MWLPLFRACVQHLQPCGFDSHVAEFHHHSLGCQPQTAVLPTHVAAYLQSSRSPEECSGRLAPGLTFEKTHSTFPLLAGERVKCRTRSVIHDSLEPEAPAMLWQIGKGLHQAQKSFLTIPSNRGKPCAPQLTSCFGAASSSEELSGAKPEHPGRAQRSFRH